MPTADPTGINRIYCNGIHRTQLSYCTFQKLGVVIMKVIPKYKLFTGLLVWLGITFLAAAIAATASVDAGSFYGELVLPDWAPPS